MRLWIARRLAVFAVAGFLISSGSALAGAPPRDPAVTEAIQPVVRALEATQARLAALPPAQTDAEKLIRMGELEQAPRQAFPAMPLAGLSEAQQRAAWSAVWSLLRPLDAANREALLAMVPAEGWFSISRYGHDAARSAFLIVQHSEPALWRRFLPIIEGMVTRGEAEGPAYALMYDRLALAEGRPQRYGSQMSCSDARYAPTEPLEDRRDLDARRASLGLKPYAEYLRMFDGEAC